MHNWDYEKNIKIEERPIWYLERLLNYGLNGEKINRKLLEQYFNQIKIPEKTRVFLKLILWNQLF